MRDISVSEAVKYKMIYLTFKFGPMKVQEKSAECANVRAVLFLKFFKQQIPFEQLFLKYSENNQNEITHQ